MSTKDTSFIPMSSESLPQQRLCEVVNLPDLIKRPDPKVELIQPLLKNYPKASPRKLTYLLSVGWAWSPMHNRIVNYYLDPRRTGWLLWNNWLEDGLAPRKWHWQFMAYGNRFRSNEKTIARHLILALGKWDTKENYVDHFHWLNDTGLLYVKALASEVWGGGINVFEYKFLY